MDVTKLVEIFFLLLSFVYSAVLLPYMKSKMSTEQLERLKVYVKAGVQAAEIIYNEPGMGVLKKQYVIAYLESLGYSVDENKLDALIESAVLELKKDLK